MISRVSKYTIFSFLLTDDSSSCNNYYVVYVSLMLVFNNIPNIVRKNAKKKIPDRIYFTVFLYYFRINFCLQMSKSDQISV